MRKLGLGFGSVSFWFSASPWLRRLGVGYLTLGQRCAFAILDRLGYARATVATAPDVVGWGPAAHGNGALAPVSWPGAKAGDREYLVVTTGLASAAIAAPSGWTLVAGPVLPAPCCRPHFAGMSLVVGRGWIG